ncbi:DUF4386 family protein [Silanimonas sp.]|jgi:hypothetical protein|uniref:DUF4386 family protein n=1 Tax=Silanimonas sp. TaxID=1929290 RepID=UPI0022C228D7|nr:DUF4386 family protein [Silanimonas sp.]MCZ8116185.1 DUF4386 family protein [Silanimonas sp.]
MNKTSSAVPSLAHSRPPAWIGWLLIASALLSLAPVVVLGPAIGWPGSLDLPAAEQLSRVHEKAGAVTLGYGLYLLYSLLVAPAIIALTWRVFGGLERPLAATIAAFAALSALARSIGILRWLTVMPGLAAAWAAGDAGTRESLELLFVVTNAYGGGIGETLGVSLLMAIAIGVLGVGALVHRVLPRSLGLGAILVALLLAGLSMPTFGLPDVVPAAGAVTVLSVWMVAVGVWTMRRQAAPAP